MLRTIWGACFGANPHTNKNRRARRPRRLNLESLESRLPTAADLFAALVSTPTNDWVVPGQSLAVSAQVGNGGDDAAGSYRVEYRLSTDSIITTADPLLASSSQGGLAAGGVANLSQSVTIPA